MTIGPLPVCFHCARLEMFPRCSAFEDEDIPVIIASGEDDHSEPVEGDHGRLFQQASLAEKHEINRRHGLPVTMGTPEDLDPDPDDDVEARYPREED